MLSVLSNTGRDRHGGGERQVWVTGRALLPWLHTLQLFSGRNITLLYHSISTRAAVRHMMASTGWNIPLTITYKTRAMSVRDSILTQYVISSPYSV